MENQPEVTEEKADQAQETEQVEEASRPAPEEGGTSQGNVDSQPSVGQESEVAEATPLVESNEVNAPADDACVEDAPANTTANGPVDNEVLITCCLWGAVAVPRWARGHRPLQIVARPRKFSRPPNCGWAPQMFSRTVDTLRSIDSRKN